MKTFLVPTDFSKNATNSLNYAVALASQVGGKLIIVHIINLPVEPQGSTMAIPYDAQLEEEYNQELNKLSKNLRSENGSRFEVETICQHGYLLASLNELVQSKSVDLVIMGTRGASNFLDNLIGSNTSLFIKSATCPVLAIPAQARFRGIKKIAYASDFESEEIIFLQQLFSLAEPFHSEVSILNVQTVHQLNIVADEQIIRDITQQFPENNYCLVTIKEDNVVEGLYKFVEENNMDVLAVSIHERSYFEDLFHISISKQLVCHTKVPVLTLPEKPYQKP